MPNQEMPKSSLQHTSTQLGIGGNPNGQTMSQVMSRISPESVKMAITIVVTVPILLVTPSCKDILSGT